MPQEELLSTGDDVHVQQLACCTAQSEGGGDGSFRSVRLHQCNEPACIVEVRVVESGYIFVDTEGEVAVGNCLKNA